ncbi:MAG: hypothetical protein ABIL09_14865 [Gemmatimonadota bacterium]
MSERARDSREHLEQGTVSGRRGILVDTAREAMAIGDRTTLRLVLNSQRPADLAELLRWMGEEQQSGILDLVAEPLASGTLAELDRATAAQVASELDEELLSGLVEGMAPDDAADVLADLPEDPSERLLALMEDEGAREVRQLMAHPTDAGGGIMTSRLVAVRESGPDDVFSLLICFGIATGLLGLWG